jgi:hypothetical protein
MLELETISGEIELLLETVSNDYMTQEAFEAQKRSFVTGNAFDVYADSDTITNASMEAMDRNRLNTRR